MLRKSSVRNIEFWALPEWRCLLIILLLPWHPAKTSKKLPFKSKDCSISILDSLQQNLKPNPDKILWGDWRMSPIASYRGIGNSSLSTDSPLRSTNQVRSDQPIMKLPGKMKNFRSLFNVLFIMSTSQANTTRHTNRKVWSSQKMNKLKQNNNKRNQVRQRTSSLPIVHNVMCH